MVKNNSIKRKKTLSILVVIIIITLLIIIPMNTQAINTTHNEFATEALLNKQNITFNLSKLDNFVKQESIKIEMVDYKGTVPYYIYRSHYNSELAVIIHEVNDIMQIPTNSDFLTKELKGLSVALAIPTEWEESPIEYEIATLRINSEVNLTDELITFMDIKSYK